MSKSTIFLLILFICILIFYFALKTTYLTNPTLHSLPHLGISPTSTIDCTLSLSPDQLNTSYGKENTIQIKIDNQGNHQIELIQLELAYDQEVLTNMHIIPGDYLKQPDVLLNKIDQNTGRISYALKVLPENINIKKDGIAATIIFTPKPLYYRKDTSIYFLPKTTIKDIDEANILKAAYGAKITLTPDTYRPALFPASPSAVIKN